MSDIRQLEKEEQAARHERHVAVVQKGKELLKQHLQTPFNVQVVERFAYLERKLDAIHAIFCGNKDVNYPEGNFRKEMMRQAQSRYY